MRRPRYVTAMRVRTKSAHDNAVKDSGNTRNTIIPPIDTLARLGMIRHARWELPKQQSESVQCLFHALTLQAFEIRVVISDLKPRPLEVQYRAQIFIVIASGPVRAARL